MPIEIQLPLTETIIKSLKCGDTVHLSGTIFTARDAAHMKLREAIKNQEPLPIEIENQIFYYAGPTPTPPGRVTGSFGPTTSSRMDSMTPMLLDRGLKAMIGKGKRSDQVKESIIKNKCIYFIAIGGAGALISQAVKSIEEVAYLDLGPESIKKLKVEKFPAIVAIDVKGNSIY